MNKGKVGSNIFLPIDEDEWNMSVLLCDVADGTTESPEDSSTECTGDADNGSSTESGKAVAPSKGAWTVGGFSLSGVLTSMNAFKNDFLIILVNWNIQNKYFIHWIYLINKFKFDLVLKSGFYTVKCYSDIYIDICTYDSE